MGDTISSLVFRPPRPTPIHPSEYFYLDVDVHSPLCSNRRRHGGGPEGAGDGNGVEGCGGSMCLDTGESDLASLDASYVRMDSAGLGAAGGDPYCGVVGVEGGAPSSVDGHGHGGGGGTTPSSSDRRTSSSPSGSVPNVRDGRVYRIPAFFIRRRNAALTLLFSHGNAEDLGMMYGRMKDLAMVLGVNILAYDYTGYGLSMPGPAHGNVEVGGGSGGGGGGGSGGGKDGDGEAEGPSENMIYRNIEAAFRYLTVTRGIPPHRIILYGRSLGSGPSCYLAAKTALNGNSVGGLVLHSPFLSVYKVVADLAGLDLGAVGDLFHNEKRARNVRCPTLLVHGKDDEVVPFWHAPRLLAAIPPEFRAQPFYVEGMGHNHIESRCRERYLRVVLNFLKNCQGGDDAAGSGGELARSELRRHRGPSPVPVHERASPSEAKENASFYVNKTWLRHARVLLREVFADAGCYVNTVGDEGDKAWGSATAARGRAAEVSGGPAAGPSSSEGTARSGSAATRSRSRRAGAGGANNASDARDDEDEFAPWKGGGRRSPPVGRQPGHPTGGGGGFGRSPN
ncbi:hypothetical protein ACHAWF_011496, partial [Thalassiosira exigua]